MLKPSLLLIELTNRCNADCWYCGRNHRFREDCDMDFGLFKRIIDLCPFTREVHPQLLGEPMLHPDFIDALSYIKKRGKRVILYTNGSLLDITMSEKLLGILGPDDEIKFSVDGFDKESYEKIRSGLSWETVSSNIANFAHLQQDRNHPVPFQIRMTRLPENESRIADWTSFWHKYTPHLNIQNRIEVLPPLSQKFVCGKPVTHVYDRVTKHLTVKSNGDLILCCCDRFGQFVFGNLMEDSPLDIYNSEGFNRVRKSMLDGVNYPYICDQCR